MKNEDVDCVTLPVISQRPRQPKAAPTQPTLYWEGRRYSSFIIPKPPILDGISPALRGPPNHRTPRERTDHQRLASPLFLAPPFDGRVGEKKKNETQRRGDAEEEKDNQING